MSRVRLSEKEAAAWQRNLMTWKLIDRELDRQLQRDSGIPHAYYAILLVLTEAGDDGMPLNQLALTLDFSPSRMSHAADKLVQEGWIARFGDPADGRVTRVRLTPPGRSAYTRATVGHLTRVREVFLDPLDEHDLDDLIRIGGKLLDALSADVQNTTLFRTHLGERR